MADEDEVFDMIVIGAGPVGITAAARAVRGGLTAAVIEERLAGGECEYYACVPSKALLRPVDLAADVSRMPGLELRGPIDAAAVLARRDEVVHHLDDGGIVSLIEKFPATFVRGRGRLAGPLRAEVNTPDGGTRALRARHAVVVATGSDPVISDVPGLREAHPWTNREATVVEQVPKRLVVLGGGPVACEMAQALQLRGRRDVPHYAQFPGHDAGGLAGRSAHAEPFNNRAVPVEGQRVSRSLPPDSCRVAAGRPPSVIHKGARPPQIRGVTTVVEPSQGGHEAARARSEGFGQLSDGDQ